MQHLQKSGSENLIKEGLALIAEGKCAAIVLAGGSGSRLGWEGPKGCFPIESGANKTLYHLISEKVPEGRQIAFMTSPETHKATISYFRENSFFGLKSGTFHFFEQPILPLKNLDGSCLEVMGPSGNGEVFRSFATSGLSKKWKEDGVEMVCVIPVDNPLANPFDPEFFGFHHAEKNEVSLKVGLKKHPNEKVGVLVKTPSGYIVREYSEHKNETSAYANFGIYCFSLDFMERMQTIDLPLHQAKKRHQGLDVIKEERFIFDVLEHAKRCSLLLTLRAETFAPLKNSTGEDSIAEVQEALRMRKGVR